ncbi:MAG: winged helix-turn-helix transcriptional regulator, partial [Burkholderia sp.]
MPAILDSFSQKILRLLQLDARRSVQEISDQVGLSSTPCWRRIKDMEQSGVIQRYTALLDREKLGLHVCALAHVHLTRHSEGGVERRCCINQARGRSNAFAHDLSRCGRTA